MRMILILLAVSCASENREIDASILLSDGSNPKASVTIDRLPDMPLKPSTDALDASIAMDRYLSPADARDALISQQDSVIVDVCGSPDYPYYWYCPVCGNCSLGGSWAMCGRLDLPKYTKCDDGGLPIR